MLKLSIKGKASVEKIKKIAEEDINQVPINMAVRTAIREISRYNPEKYSFGSPGLSVVRRYLIELGRKDLTGLSQAWKEETGLK
jgi:hypothetical protein